MAALLRLNQFKLFFIISLLYLLRLLLNKLTFINYNVAFIIICKDMPFTVLISVFGVNKNLFWL
ncbi:hypothetical protein BHC54_03930 [Snodgrassella alvi]|uniref:Uncharacterized protein n=1 Tax=Snodgrassella alvi TaxID=1196083 RepID=A0A2N9X7Q8_9NEIS|nr:hypothetical protein BHC54_03930 [Snodgrassella alvi]